MLDPKGFGFIRAIMFAGVSYFAVRWAVIFVAFLAAAR